MLNFGKPFAALLVALGCVGSGWAEGKYYSPFGGAPTFDRTAFDPVPPKHGAFGNGLNAFGGDAVSAFVPSVAPSPDAPCPPTSENPIGPAHEPRLWVPCVEVSAGYSALWFNASKLPVVITTGSTGDTIPGALGQPSTSTLFSGFGDPGPSAAFNTTLTYWINGPELAFETSFFIMEQRSFFQSFASDASGNPLLARPFFDAAFNTENSDPRSLPSFFRGSTSDSMSTRLMGAEANFKWRTHPTLNGSSLNFYFGVRWLSLDERYQNYDTVSFLNDGSTASFSDRFATYNNFYAGQFGAEWLHRVDERLTIVLTGKVAAGPNEQLVVINGQTVRNDVTSSTLLVDNTQGFYAQRTNVGRYFNRETAVLAQGGIKLQFDLTERLRFNVGYSYLNLNNTIRPGDVISRTINIQTPGVATTAPQLPGPPTFRQSNFNAQIVDLGLEFRF